MSETIHADSVAKNTTTKERGRPHRHRAKLWLPDQPGAWAMALYPALGGIIVGGVSWRNVWLFVAWTLCYCFQFTASRWLAARAHEVRGRTRNCDHEASGIQNGKVYRTTGHTSNRSATYLLPAAAYAIVTAVVGLPLLVAAPLLLWWIPAYAALAALSLGAAWLRRERSLWGNAVAVIAAGGMALVAVSLGSRYYESGMPSRIPLPGVGVITAAAFIATEYASALFVKTMIREHGHRGYYALSVVYHLALTAAGFAMNAVWGVAACVLLLRAAALPLTHRRLKPIFTGMVEVATSLMNLVVIVVVLL
ncbi:YwiC-like family protein [Bifidobacterium sp. ESL0763]|uniref:YwiC-like family protein n=1 Tax=Bifidobacterium sp. ESL0763 TaxID=2983227 RepID=UPI0023F63180|nr:YwiC-like family protein [Bifidobacterium sp. ESL0763]MDF7663251.1 YwiC-like family protein [Bifidobacterium sp. ESL0763]